MMLLLTGFVLGVISTFIGLYLFLRNAEKKIKDELKDKPKSPSPTELANKIFSKGELIGSVKYRFKMIDDKTSEQQNLLNGLKGPSAGAAVSRHRNSVISRIKELEEEKSELMRSILDDGIDPEVTILTPSGDTEKVKMSEALSMREAAKPASSFQPKNKTDPNLIRMKRRFRVVKNEDTDGDS